MDNRITQIPMAEYLELIELKEKVEKNMVPLIKWSYDRYSTSGITREYYTELEAIKDAQEFNKEAEKEFKDLAYKHAELERNCGSLKYDSKQFAKIPNWVRKLFRASI